MKKTGPFYLAVIDKPLTSAENSERGLTTERFLPHSARTTVVKKLKRFCIPKCEIQNITGHNSEPGLDDYDKGDENEQRMMSNIVHNARSPSTSRQRLHPLSSVNDQTQSTLTTTLVYNFSHCNKTLNVAGNHSLQSSLSQSKRANKRIVLQDSDSG